MLSCTCAQALFSDDLEFSVPAGVDFISSNESVHFSSVLVFHPSTKTLHVDDTFMFIPTPAAAEFLNFKQGTVQLHPTLAGTRPDALPGDCIQHSWLGLRPVHVTGWVAIRMAFSSNR